MGRRTKARECAFQILYQWDLTHAPLERVIQSFWSIRSTTDATRQMAERLVRGVAALIEDIDQDIGRVATNWRFERIAAVDRNILRIAAYELRCELQTPAPVVIDEAVEMAKRFSEADSPGFVNGVLDAIRRAVRPGEATEAR